MCCFISKYLGVFKAMLLVDFFLKPLLEYNCFTMVCQFLLYNKVNQLCIYIYPHISSLLHLPPTLSIPPLQVVTKHQAHLPVLCNCFRLASLHLVVYISLCHSLTLWQLTLPPPCVLKSILYVCVFIPVLPLGSSEPFFSPLDSIYMCQHTVFVLLTYFTL